LSGVVTASTRAGISPDVFTAVGIAGGMAAAGILAVGAARPHPLWAVALAVALAIRLAGANLDGAVARARKVARPWGFVLNEIGDRVGDLAPMIVLAHLTGGWWGLIGLAGSFLPTFASLALAGADGPRINGGPLGKTERCALMVLVTLFAPWWSLYAATSALIGFGGLVTAAVRLRTGYRQLSTATTDGTDHGAGR
jgi:CDP-diacylglycerol--glycerol-3-phosphate 3-phosphatidyltransferase